MPRTELSRVKLKTVNSELRVCEEVRRNKGRLCLIKEEYYSKSDQKMKKGSFEKVSPHKTTTSSSRPPIKSRTD